MCNRRSLSSTNSASQTQAGHWSTASHLLTPVASCNCWLNTRTKTERYMRVLQPVINAGRAKLKQDVGQTASRLLTPVVSRSHALNTCTQKIVKFGGLNTSWSTTPHPPTTKASTPDRSLEGYRYKQRRH